MQGNGINGGPVNILLVEDNKGHAELVMRNFDDHRIAKKIYHVTDGEEALGYLFRRGDTIPEKSPRPHMVLLDLCIPRIDGLEVLKKIKSSKKPSKIV